MTSIATNAQNDIYLDTSGNLAMVTGIQACAQDCEHIAKVRLGEMVLNTQGGIPYLEQVFQNSNTLAFKQALINAWLTVPNVTGIQSVTVSIVGGVLNYTAVINTIFGQVTL